MRFIFSIMALASITGALIVLYVGAGSFLKLNQASDEEQALAAERTSAMISRMAQRSGVLAKAQASGNPSFGPLNLSPWSLPVAQSALDQTESATPWQTDADSVLREEPKSYAATVSKPPVVQPSRWAEAVYRIFSAPAPAPYITPRRTPTPAEEALAAYRKYATPQ